MQFEKDMASDHRELFEAARALLLSVEGVSETEKTKNNNLSKPEWRDLSYENDATWNRCGIPKGRSNDG